MKLGKNIDDIQKANRCMVLKLLLQKEVVTRIDLSKQTGLNKATITNVINEFEQLGVIENVADATAENGRKTKGIRLNLQDVVTIVVRVYRFELEFAICNLHGEISSWRKVPFTAEDEVSTLLELIRTNTSELIEACSNFYILGISIAILGWLFHKNNHYYARPDVYLQISNVDFKEEMEKMFPGYEVLIDHDANMSALAEWVDYTRETNITNAANTSMLNIVCGIGFGGGIIINGDLYHGANGIAGEIGHLGINFNSNIFSIGNPKFRGKYEDYASPRALQENVLEHLIDFPDTCLTSSSSLQDIYLAFDKNDPLALWAVDRMANLLAYGLFSLIFLLDPSVIVLGDKVLRSERFLNNLKQNLNDLLPGELFDELNIRISRFGDEGVLKGSAIAMTKHYLSTYMMIDFLREQYSAGGPKGSIKAKLNAVSN